MSVEEDRELLSTVTQASAPVGAVYLSYASEDADSADRITAALRSAGIKVWFDQSELRDGDAWDQAIPKLKRRRLHRAIIARPAVALAHNMTREPYL